MEKLTIQDLPGVGAATAEKQTKKKQIIIRIKFFIKYDTYLWQKISE